MISPTRAYRLTTEALRLDMGAVNEKKVAHTFSEVIRHLCPSESFRLKLLPREGYSGEFGVLGFYACHSCLSLWYMDQLDPDSIG